MTAEPAEIAKTEYQAGQLAFERGNYRQSVQHLEKASALVERNSMLGGEVQIWLVTAYEAMGQRSDAINLCRQLTHHPDVQTRKQGRRLLTILEAPQLRTRPEWVTQIPELGNLSDSSGPVRRGAGSFSPSTAAPPEPRKFELEPADLSQVQTSDNRFTWFALVAMLLVLGGILWFM